MNNNFQTYWHNSYHCILPMAAIFLVSLSLPSFSLFSDPADVLQIHLLFELFSVIVAALIAVISWYDLKNNSRSKSGILLAGFTIVAAMDLLHALTYAGMPRLIIENSNHRAIFFWLTGRSFVALTLILFILPTVRIRMPRWLWLVIALLISTLFFWIGTFRLDWMPNTFVQELGVTSFKKNYEYFLSGIDILLFLSFIYLAPQKNPQQYFAFASACLIMALGEILFTGYKAPSDFLNIFGHAFKIVSYAFLYRYAFVSAVEQPYQRLFESEKLLQTSEERFALAMQGANDGLWDWNLKTDEVYYSPRWKEMLGYRDDEIEHRLDSWAMLVHPDDKERALKTVEDYINERKNSFAIEMRMRHKDGHWLHILSRAFLVRRNADGHPVRLVGTHVDITEKKKSEELIWRQANFDDLTGLPNRNMFQYRFDQTIKKSHRTGLPLALLFVDLDHFKEINDTLGHSIGDTLLKEAADRLKACVRESDTVARFGGDEFTVLLGELIGPDCLPRIIQDILQKLAQPFRLGHEMSYLSASIGIALYPDDANNIEDLLKNADQAMYQAKYAGRNRYCYFTPSMQKAAQTRMWIANELRDALNKNQFWVAYQPIVELANGNIHKAEALLRWQHPSRGLISPAEFIPIAESSGLIVDIGEWVFREVASQVKQWRAMFHPDFQISVNKSPVQFHSAVDHKTSWIDYLQNLGLPGQSIVVEITEGLLLDAGGMVTEKFIGFRDAGIEVSLDDFGTGYSSLSYLKKFDIDYLKIDRSFVRNLTADSDDMALCEAIIVMAHKLRIKVIAEGIETPEQRDLLLAVGCDYGQGYLFSKPAPAEVFETLLKA